ncbi:ABC-2 type transport system ATP-binding protein [Curtobacterium sp. PhB25]|uniref:ABC transporter ATP-binding protein n=1 Tax=unclassified Curtobacterium TaxID=257496 RepID=UPI0010EC0F58|nr:MULTISPECIES: ABC transporter ATP-binding protein [unclassified Curtobacterium]TDW51129.1 ABC-2 type transport system ATP-binding protein [Curtobacterium sp. PhB42]TDW56025.1 ABC-2 type transport system ATP-binding protein [Curtobacterium sp. PhB190]TDW73295.1 ABC-2 type transport system ATP-binding protein [Curtobacterium sp. PhB25]
MAARAENEDVYATTDAAWMTEASDTDEQDADERAADRVDAAAGDDADDDDMGEPDARDASVDDEMTDDTTAADTTAADTDPVTEPQSDAVPGTAVPGPAARAAAAAPTTTTGARPAKARTTKQRTKRPAKGAGTTGTVPPGPASSDATSATDATVHAAQGAPETDAPEADAATSPAAKKRAPRATAPKAPQKLQPVVLAADGLVKRYGQTLAVDEVDLEIRQGSIFGVVGPNGAGKTTTLSMITGLLRPDAGSVTVLDHDVWADPTAAKRSLGVLPDRLRLFDRLTGAQLLYYSATLRGLDGATARERSTDLAEAFGLGEALGRQVADYSVGMAKKIALAATLIHSPRVLVLDEPFESVDPVSAATITDILRRYTRGGGTVVLSSHSMELVQRTCDSVAIIVGGKVLASGTMAQVRGRKSLEDKFVELAGGRVVAESMEWLHSFSG